MRVDVPRLYAALDEARQGRGLSWREGGRQLGVGASTFTRMTKPRHGVSPDAVGLDAGTFVTPDLMVGATRGGVRNGEERRGVTGQLDDVSDEVGAGWHPLIAQLHTDLLALDPDYRVSQVKEKYGELRVYLTSEETPDTESLIDAATAASLTICELCGQPGAPRTVNGWVYTRCSGW
jgi:hypothetical protein